MDAHTLGILVFGAAGLGLVVWVLHKIGRALASIAEALAAAAVVFLALWAVVKGFTWLLKQAVTRWRTSLTLLGALVWWHWLGWRVPERRTVRSG